VAVIERSPARRRCLSEAGFELLIEHFAMWRSVFDSEVENGLRRDSNCTCRQKREGKIIFLLLSASGARFMERTAPVPANMVLFV
jgi:hypothetical protein